MLTLQAFITTLVVADFDALQAASRKLNSPNSARELAFVVVTAAAVAAFWIGLYVWDRLKQPVVSPTEGAGLFGELCRTHRLTKTEREMLLTIGNNLPNPAIVFVDPNAIEQFEAANAGHAEQCRQLRDKLFAAP